MKRTLLTTLAIGCLVAGIALISLGQPLAWFLIAASVFFASAKREGKVSRVMGQLELQDMLRELDRAIEQCMLDNHKVPRSLMVSEKPSGTPLPAEVVSLAASDAPCPERPGEIPALAKLFPAQPGFLGKVSEGREAVSLAVSETPQLAAASSSTSTNGIKSQQQLAPPEKSAESGAENFTYTPEGALAWLHSIDSAKELGKRGSGLFAKEWVQLCTKEPEYVLSELRPHLVRGMARRPIPRPISWLATKVRAEGRF